jgi:hypothetical protein
MPSVLRKRVWLGIAAGAAGLGTASVAGTAMSQGTALKAALSALSGSAAKGVIALVIVGGAGLGVAALHSSPHAAPDAKVAREAPLVPNEAPPAVTATSPARDPVPKAGAHAPRARAAGTARSGVRSPAQGPAQSSDDNVDSRPPEPAPERAASRLREESAAVLAIRETLLTGNTAEALRMLERARAEFPSGALTQEREALTVRALAESHQNEAAQKRGEAFLRAFPRSPYAAEVRALLAR